jgi:hypothetical protein
MCPAIRERVKTMTKKLEVIKGAPAVDPVPIPTSLGQHGQRLWREVQNEFSIQDCGGRELLAQACAALDMAVMCRERIIADGIMQKMSSGMREHALVKHELANRAFVVSTLQKLGVTTEPAKLHGAPYKSYGYA